MLEASSCVRAAFDLKTAYERRFDCLDKDGDSRVMKPEESYSARDTLYRLEEELINLEEHPGGH
jgi:hypothetical protein